MATIIGLTSAAMQAIVDATVASGSVNGSGHLILTLHNGSTIDAGYVVGPTGPAGTNGTNGVDGNSLKLNQIAVNNPTAADWSNSGFKITGVANGSAAQDVATISNLGVKMDKAGGTFTGAVVEAAVNLTFATTILVNAALGNTFRVTLTASTGTLDLPSNPTDNQKIIFEIKQDATGGRTLAYNAAYQFTTQNPAPTLSTAANAVDELIFIYNATSGKWRFQGALLGYT